jgi:hypothetical protein
MSSSTSSSEPRPRVAWKIGLCLLAVFVALEIVTRTLLVPRSRDLVRFAAYPERAEALVDQPGLRLAFLGNSATQRGLAPAQFVADLPDSVRRPVNVELFLADGSEINTWHYIAKEAFWRRDRRPDWMVVTFFGPFLEDSNPFEIGRLAQYFTRLEDWPELFALDLPTTGDRAEFLLSTTWATYAARDRIKNRVLGAFVPDYPTLAEELNAGQFRRQQKAEPPPRTCRALARFLAAAQEHRTRVCFVAFPTRRIGSEAPEPLNPEVVQLIRGAGMAFLDLREVPGLSAEHYKDDVHLTPAGAAIYTRHFAEAMAPILARD